ncbi:hypothetical protein WJX73_008965 [Symbiochloris irregularis]|uniref:Glycosyl transferase family 1 domain-containing protein n=1 Tax=Symbiochloris irregularis TaxID=706552 RepID=A0AAW1PCP5_9CHLO
MGWAVVAALLLLHLAASGTAASVGRDRDVPAQSQLWALRHSDTAKRRQDDSLSSSRLLRSVDPQTSTQSLHTTSAADPRQDGLLRQPRQPLMDLPQQIATIATDDPMGASKRRRARQGRPQAELIGSQLETLRKERFGTSTVVNEDDEDDYYDDDVEVPPEKVKQMALDQATHAHLDQVAKDAEAVASTASGPQLKVCILTADFWGMKAAGGTATAYHLLAGVLGGSKDFKVTFLGASNKFAICNEAKPVNSKHNVDFTCLEPRHFEPEVVETFPYERLSHAVLAWLQENPQRCDVLHGHEWGGAFVDVITAVHFRQLRPGMRVAVEPHGGHFWSTQGQVQRPMDVVSLRIDNAERMANQLNDIEISPTNYMTAFLRQRGWKLPRDTITIPNVIPEVEPAALKMMGQEKEVWRVAFFSRLEERKGIKLFTEAVANLNVSGLPRFEVFFVGSEAKIDMRPSSVWLKETTSKWPWKTNLRVGATRDEALDILSSDGVLLVLCSLIDNMPYVVAEAAVKGIPFLVFDVGGTLEMFNGKAHPQNVVLEPSLEALTAKLSEVLHQGKIRSVKLNDAVTNGRQLWLQWHADFAKKFQSLVAEDEQLLAQVAKPPAEAAQLNIIRLNGSHNALELWEPLCKDHPATDNRPLLLLPPEYEFLDPKKGPTELWKIATIAAQRNNVGALTFGAQLPSGKHSFPTSPTWMMYGGDDVHCVENAPVLIDRLGFCKAFLAEARVFRHYTTWVLAMLLHQQDMQLHTYPQAMFKVLNFTSQGYSCMPDKVPVDRALTFPVASNLYRDAEELLRNLHLAPFSKPMVSLIDDFPVQQKHKGWQFGYLTSNTSDEISYLKWHHADTGLVRDGKWSCGSTTFDYPSMHHSLLHPCANAGGGCCNSSAYAPFVLRYESFFHSRQALLVLAYEVWPTCGDGLDFIVRLTPAGSKKKTQVLLKRGYEPDANGQPNRQKIEWRLHIRTGDVIDFIVDPRTNHDCDGLYIVDVSIWTDAAVVSSQR